jgi:serine/threonine-protein phosphatase 2A regulatory subunit B''
VDFRAFTYLLICTEDKASVTALHFWFRLCDLDDDGVLSIHEISQLYAQQFERMGMAGNETIPFADVLRQLIDAVNPRNRAMVTIKDLVASKQGEVFFTTLVDLHRFLIREYQVPVYDPEANEFARKLTPWDLYVMAQYNVLINESDS